MYTTDNPVNPSGVMRSGMHELGHAVFHANAQYIPTELLNRMKTEHGEFLSLLRKQDPAAGERRLSITHEDAQVLEAGGKLGANEYNANFDEYMAEQFVKHIETKVAKGEGARASSTVFCMLSSWMPKLVAISSQMCQQTSSLHESWPAP